MFSIPVRNSGAMSSRWASISPRSSTPSRNARSFADRSNRKANRSRQSATVSSIHASTFPLAPKRSRGRQIASFWRNSRGSMSGAGRRRGVGVAGQARFKPAGPSRPSGAAGGIPVNSGRGLPDDDRV